MHVRSRQHWSPRILISPAPNMICRWYPTFNRYTVIHAKQLRSAVRVSARTEQASAHRQAALLHLEED